MAAGCVSSAAERNYTAYVAVVTNTCILTESVCVCCFVTVIALSLSRFLYPAVVLFHVFKTLIWIYQFNVIIDIMNNQY